MPITKPPVLPAWADTGDKVQPSNTELATGWLASSTPPSRQRFNWVLNFCANAVRYFSRRGLPDYDTAETYMAGDRVIGDDGKTYRSLVDNNTAQTPSTSPTKWERWGFTAPELGANAQTQPFTAFTTTGSSGAYVLTPTPAITAYAANQRFRVKFHTVGNGVDTLNISGLGAKSIKQYDSTGAKVAAVIAASQLVDIEYDGAEMVILAPLPSPDFAVNAGGTINALTATYVQAPVLVNGLTLRVRASGANTSTVPTFAPNALAAKTIVKGANAPLLAGDIAGAGHWLELQYDLSLEKWVLQNPVNGISPPAMKVVAGVIFLGATGAIEASSGVSSVVRNSFDNYTINFSSVQPDANYIIHLSIENSTTIDTWQGRTISKTINSATITLTKNAYEPTRGFVTILRF